jgi:hypothetical protein
MTIKIAITGADYVGLFNDIWLSQHVKPFVRTWRHLKQTCSAVKSNP